MDTSNTKITTSYEMIILGTDIPELSELLKKTGIPIEPWDKAPDGSPRHYPLNEKYLYVFAYMEHCHRDIFCFMLNKANERASNFLALLMRRDDMSVSDDANLGYIQTFSRENLCQIAHKKCIEALTGGQQ